MAQNIPLLWTKASVRKVYKDHGIWPTWIGSDYEKTTAKEKKDKENEPKTRLPLPVLLWPEQKEFIDKYQTREETAITGKRKRNEENNDEKQEDVDIPNTEEVEPRKKKQKSGTSWSVLGFLSTLWNRLCGVVPTPEVESDVENTKMEEMLPSETIIESTTTPSTLTSPLSSSSSTKSPSSSNTINLPLVSSMTKYDRLKAIRAEVFEYFQKDRIYLIGPADVFGGDYSLYKGVASPDDAHSIATVQVRPTTKIAAKDILAFCRLQNQVAKSAVFAFRKSIHSTQVGEEVSEGEAVEEDRIGVVVLNFRSVSIRIQTKQQQQQQEQQENVLTNSNANVKASSSLPLPSSSTGTGTISSTISDEKKEEC